MQVKFNWKVQRDHEERGHSIESIKVPPTLQSGTLNSESRTLNSESRTLNP